MNNRWSVNEEKELIKDISQMKTYNELSQKYNRSANALELRIKKIVYDNIVNNKSPQMIGGHLNLPIDKIKQYYYSYKEMLEKNGKPTINIDLDNNAVNNTANNIVNIGGNKSLDNKSLIKTEDNRVSSMQEENKTFKEIIENVKMRHQLRKLLKAGKLSPEMKDVLKDILDS